MATAFFISTFASSSCSCYESALSVLNTSTTRRTLISALEGGGGAPGLIKLVNDGDLLNSVFSPPINILAALGVLFVDQESCVILQS